MALEIELTEDALALVRQRGGTMALDFIPPLG